MRRRATQGGAPFARDAIGRSDNLVNTNKCWDLDAGYTTRMAALRVRVPACGPARAAQLVALADVVLRDLA